MAKTRRFRYQMMNRRIGEGKSPEEWDEIIAHHIKEGFREELSARELTLLDQSSEVTDEVIAVLEVMDEFILFQAKTVGWRITLCRLVHGRMAFWDGQGETGAKKFERLGRAMAHAARLLQGRGSPPLTDTSWYRARKEFIDELKILLQAIRDLCNVSRRAMDKDKLLQWVADQIVNGVETFVHLSRELPGLLAYLDEDPHDDCNFLRFGQRVPAAAFYDKWMGWRTRHEPEQLRQKISRIGSTRH